MINDFDMWYYVKNKWFEYEYRNVICVKYFVNKRYCLNLLSNILFILLFLWIK